MEKEHIDPQNNEWVDEILGSAAPAEEISADAHADNLSKLTHPDDIELERIMDEVKQENVPVDILEGTQQFDSETIAETETPSQSASAARRKSRQADAKKARPERQKGYGLFGIPHLLATAVWLLLIVAIGVSLGRMLWVCCADLMAFGKDSQEITITVTEEDDIASVSQKLGDAGLVRYPGLFKLFAEITGKADNIDFGTYTLNTHFDYNAMLNAMASAASRRGVVTIMFPDGYNCAQIFKLLEENEVCTVADLEAYAATGDLEDYWFLEGVTRGSKYCLEGYLAPDTYSFYTNDDPRRVLEKFLDEFDDRFTDIMKQELADMQVRFADMLRKQGYGSDYIAQNSLTLHQLVTLASIVEKEKSADLEGYSIASVFYNRLMNASTYPFLNSDATILYATDYYNAGELVTDAQINASPYNTRNHEGLPPGPISNPGVYSLYAVLDPNDTNYYYYVLDPSAGVHLFSKTYDEHLRKVNSLGY